MSVGGLDITAYLGVLTVDDTLCTAEADDGYRITAVQYSGREVRVLATAWPGPGEPPAPLIGGLAP